MMIGLGGWPKWEQEVLFGGVALMVKVEHAGILSIVLAWGSFGKLKALSTENRCYSSWHLVMGGAEWGHGVASWLSNSEAGPEVNVESCSGFHNSLIFTFLIVFFSTSMSAFKISINWLIN